MIENGMRYLRGYVKIQIQGYSPERFLNLCSYHHILIWGLAYEDHCYELCMSVRDFKRIRPFAKKTHTKVRVKEKYGFPFSLYNYLYFFIADLFNVYMGYSFYGE